MPAFYEYVDRSVRIYDGTTPTPFYVVVPLLDALTFDTVPPLPDEELILDSGQVTSHSGYVTTNEAPIFQYTEIPFRFSIESTARSLINAFANPFDLSTWLVGADTWSPVLPANAGTRQNSRGVNIPVPTSSIARNQNMVNVYVRVSASPGDPGGDSLVIGLLGMCAGQVQFVQEDPRFFYAITMRHYGAIVTGLADFPAGTETTPT